MNEVKEAKEVKDQSGALAQRLDSSDFVLTERLCRLAKALWKKSEEMVGESF